MSQAQKEKRRKKRQVRMRFKLAVRVIIINKTWFDDRTAIEGATGINSSIFAKRRRGIKSHLKILDKALLRKEPEMRTPEEQTYLEQILNSLPCLVHFPINIRRKLAQTVVYRFYQPGRVIIKEGHTAEAFYIVLDGVASCSAKSFSKAKGDFVDKFVTLINAGETFGERAIMDGVRRRLSVVSMTNIELLVLSADYFIKFLMTPLQNIWGQIYQVLNIFSYFKDWTRTQKKECSSVSKILEYKPNEMVLGKDELGNSVFFLLSGQCTILQTLKVKVFGSQKGQHYELMGIEKKTISTANILEKIYKEAKRKQKLLKSPQEQILLNISQDDMSSMDLKASSTESIIKQTVTTVKKMQLTKDASENNTTDSSETYSNDLHSAKNIDSNILFWKTQDAFKIEQHFMDVATLSSGAIFGIGEHFEDCEIFAKTKAQCLIIPQYWLFAKTQNPGDLWNRYQMYLNTKIPTRQEVFNIFVKNQRFKQVRQHLSKNIDTKSLRSLTTKTEDVPIISRIVDSFRNY